MPKAKRATGSVIYTIGYEGLTPGEFLDILNAHNIQVLVDVRELPLSRKPGFSKRSLSNLLEEAGIEYVHVQSLGAPREVRHALRQTNNWKTYRIRYEKHLNNQSESLDLLVNRSKTLRVCLMCFEADHTTCHRSIITSKLERNKQVSRTNHLDRDSVPSYQF